MNDFYEKEASKNFQAWKELGAILYSNEMWQVDVKMKNRIRKVYNFLGDFPENLNIDSEI